MKTAAFAIALLLSGAAIAQTYQPDPDADLTPDTTTTMPDESTTTPTDVTTPDTSVTEDTTATTTTTTTQQQTMATNMAPASGQVVQPSNANPERDARGISVISAEAIVPAGWNGIAGTATGGPLVDPVTGEAMAPDNYPACSSTVTDNCLQTYERGRSA